MGACAFAPDKPAHRLKGSQNGRLRLWDADSGPASSKTHQDTRSVPCAFAPDSQRSRENNDGTLRLWDADSGSACACSKGHQARSCLRLRPDGQRIVLGTATARFWNPEPASRSAPSFITSATALRSSTATKPHRPDRRRRLAPIGWQGTRPDHRAAHPLPGRNLRAAAGVRAAAGGRAQIRMIWRLGSLMIRLQPTQPVELAHRVPIHDPGRCSPAAIS